MSTDIVMLIIFGGFIGLCIIVGIITYLYIKIPDWWEDHKIEQFKKNYPNIYKIYSDYWDKRNTLENENKKLGQNYKLNCDEIKLIDRLLSTIPVECDRYIINNDKKITLKEENVQLLSKQEENNKQIEQLCTKEYQIAEIFFFEYIGNNIGDLEEEK